MKPLRYSYEIDNDVTLSIVRSGVDFEVFRGKTVLITGGTGFFGIWMLSALVQVKKKLQGDLRLIVVSRNPDKFLNNFPQNDFSRFVEFIKGDIKNFVLENIQVTHLMHLATTNADETFVGEDQLNKLDLLYFGTRNVLQQCGPSLEKILFTSSGVAYGRTQDKLVSESTAMQVDTTKSDSALAIGKLTAEYMIAYYSEKYKCSYSIARCFSFSGQYLPLDLHYAFGNFIQNVIEKNDIIINGDGLALRSYLYIGDAAAWLLRLFSEPQNQIFNVGSEKAISILELAKKVADAAGESKKIKVQGLKKSIGNFEREIYVPSIAKITSAHAGLTEWTSIDDIIKKMLFIK